MTQPANDPSVLRYIRAVFGTVEEGQSDFELLERFTVKKDQSAFELLVWRHASMVRRMCRSVLRDHHAAEDAAQAAFLTLARKPPTILKHQSIAGWLHKVAYRIAVRAAVRKGKQTPTSYDLAEVPSRVTGPVLGRDPEQAEYGPLVHEEVARLPEKYRVPVVLCFFEGLTFVDAARKLNWPAGTVACRIARAKEILHKRLSQRGVALPVAGIAALLTTDPLSAVSPTFVDSTVRAAVAFASKQAVVPGASAFSQSLAQGAVRDLVSAQLQWNLGTALVVGLFAIGGFASFATSRHEERNDVTRDKTQIAEVLKPQPVLAPQVQKPKPAFDLDTVKEFEKTGAIFGGFVETSHSGVRSFIPGKAGAEKGIPGFKWHQLPEGKFPTVPEVRIPFGMDLTQTAIKGDDFRKLGEMPRLTCLVLDRTQVDDDALQEFRELKELSYLSLMQTRVSSSGVRDLAGFKKLSYLNVENQKVNDEVIEKFGDARLLSIFPFVQRGNQANGNDSDRVVSLNLQEAPISNSSLRHLAHFKNVEDLNLFRTNVQEKKLEWVKQFPKLKMVTPPHFTAQAAAEMRKQGTMHLISFASTLDGNRPKSDGEVTQFQIVDATDLDLIREVAQLPKLSAIHFEQRVTRDSIQALEKAKALKSITMDVSSYSLEMVDFLLSKELMAALPWCTDNQGNPVSTLDQVKRVDFSAIQVLVTDGLIETCVRFPNLRSIIVTNCAITGKGFQPLSKLTHLEEIEASGCHLSSYELAKLGHFPALRTFHFNEQFLTDEVMKSWIKARIFHCYVHARGENQERPKSMDEITAIDFHQSRVTTRCVEELKVVPRLKSIGLGTIAVDSPLIHILAEFPALELVHFGQTQYTDEVIEALVATGLYKKVGMFRGAKGLPATSPEDVHSVYLADCPLTDKALKSLARFPNIVNLNLSRTNITDEGLPQIAQFKKLQQFVFDGSKITLPAAAKLPQCAAQLNYQPKDITDQVLSEMITNNLLHAYSGATGDKGARATDTKSIRFLTLAGSAVTSEGLAKLAALDQLEILDLNHVPSAHHSLEVLSTIPKLRQLRMTCDDPNGEGTNVEFNHLAKFKTLEILSIPTQLYNDETIRLLVDMKMLHVMTGARGTSGIAKTDAEIVTLDCSGTMMTGDCLEAIARLTNIQHLHLNNIPLKTEIRLSNFKNLQTLRMSGTPVKDDIIQQIITLKNLETLDISGTQITRAALEPLSGMGTLKSLTLPPLTLDKEGLDLLTAFTNLERLDLQQVKLEAKLDSVISAWKHLEQIRFPVGYKFDDATITAFAKAGKLRLTGFFYLGPKGTSDADIVTANLPAGITTQSLHHVAACRKLETLMITGMDLSGKTLERVEFPKVKWLALNNVKTGPDFQKLVRVTEPLSLTVQVPRLSRDDIAALTSNPKLHTLNLNSNNPVDGTTAQPFADAVGLTQLSVYSGQVTVEAAEAIAAAPALKNLSITGTAKPELLKGFLKSRSLTEMTVLDSGISSTEEFKAINPKVRVELIVSSSGD